MISIKKADDEQREDYPWIDFWVYTLEAQPQWQGLGTKMLDQVKVDYPGRCIGLFATSGDMRTDDLRRFYAKNGFESDGTSLHWRYQ